MLNGVCPSLRYFELFDVVSELPSEERVKVLQAANECTSDEETGGYNKNIRC